MKSYNTGIIISQVHAVIASCMPSSYLANVYSYSYVQCKNINMHIANTTNN